MLFSDRLNMCLFLCLEQMLCFSNGILYDYVNSTMVINWQTNIMHLFRFKVGFVTRFWKFLNILNGQFLEAFNV